MEELKKGAVALWCLIGKNEVLMQRLTSKQLDRAFLSLPRFEESNTSREDIDQMLGSIGLNSVRKSLISLGTVFEGQAEHGHLVQMYALHWDEKPKKIKEGWVLQSLTDTEWSNTVIGKDALLLTGAYLYFSRPESMGMPKDYEVFGSVNLALKKDDYFEKWYTEVVRDFEGKGVVISLSKEEENLLEIKGRKALCDEDIFFIRSRLVDLARHIKGRVWITEIINGAENLQDFADPLMAQKINDAGYLIISDE